MLQGVEPGRCGEVFDLVLTTLEGLQGSGFNASAIEAAINSIEFSLRCAGLGLRRRTCWAEAV